MLPAPPALSTAVPFRCKRSLCQDYGDCDFSNALIEKGATWETKIEGDVDVNIHSWYSTGHEQVTNKFTKEKKNHVLMSLRGPSHTQHPISFAGQLCVTNVGAGINHR